MGKIIAYLRASTDKQDVSSQRLEILEYSRNKNLYINDFIEITISSRKTTKQRRIDELLEKLNDSDTLIVTELSRLGRSTAEVIALMNGLKERDIRVIIIKQNLDIAKDTKDMTAKVMITLLSLFSELERDFVSIRTKEALKARKAQGVILGKPKGTVQKSKFDKDKERIIELLNLGLSIRKIAKLLGYSNNIGLNSYINARKLKENITPNIQKEVIQPH